MITQGSLFDLPAAYPDAPGWKRAGTSKDAAEAIAPRAKSLREQVLDAIREKPSTPEQIAKRIGVPVMNVRPRCSELVKLGEVVDSGKRGKAMGGRQAVVWKAVAR